MAETSKTTLGEAREAHSVRKNDWEIPANALTFGERISGGHFGEVFKGRFWGTDVAIKKLTQGLNKDDQIIGDLRKEATILSSLRHPNVVFFMGLCTEPVCIVTEYCPRGCLFDILHDPEVTINFETMMKIAIGIANGMAYLHNLKQKIIHRDLKSHNVQVGTDWSPKITDFGISHVRKQAGAMPGSKHHGVFGTPEWMAPEVLQGLKYDESVDVYSYGIVLTELLTRQMPFRDKYQIFDYMDLVSCVIDDGAVPTIPAWASDEIRGLIEGCVDRTAKRRPNFVAIIEMLNFVLTQHSHEDNFKTYDVQRIKNMLESARTFFNMLAAREIGEIQGTADSSLIDEDFMSQFVNRLTELLGYWNPQLQLVVCEALIQILVHSENADQYMDIIIDGQGHEEMVQVVDTYTGSGEEEELLAKCQKLRSFLQNKLEMRCETESVLEEEERCAKCDAPREIINGKPAHFCANCGNEYEMENLIREKTESIRTLFEHLNIDKEYAQNFIDEGLGPADIPYLHFRDLCRLIPNVRQRTLINECSKQMLETQDGFRSKTKKKKSKTKKKKGSLFKFGPSRSSSSPTDEEWDKLQARRQRRTPLSRFLRGNSTDSLSTDPSISSQGRLGVSQRSSKSQQKRIVTVGDEEDSKPPGTYERENSPSSQRSSDSGIGVHFLSNRNEQQEEKHVADPTYNHLSPQKPQNADKPTQPNPRGGFHDEKMKNIIFDEFNAPEQKEQKRNKSSPIKQDELTEIKKLGGGSFGWTFKAKYKSQVVVIKASKDGTTSDDFEELGTYLKLTLSPNVLSIIGVCQSFIHERIEVPTLGIVVPFQSNGSLRQFVLKHGPRLNERQYLNMVIGMARGLEHLHSNGMIHRDLACRNYLVSSEGRIVIADFGLSRALGGPDPDNLYYRFHDATIPWRTASPEMLRTRKCTLESDVWAFGITLWELYHPLLIPFPDQRDAIKLTFILCDKHFSFTLDYGDKNSDDENSKKYPNVLKEAVVKCCDMDPAKRITIRGVIEMLTTPNRHGKRSSDGPPTDPRIPLGHDNEGSKQHVMGIQCARKHDVPNSRMVLSVDDHPEYNTELVRQAKEHNIIVVNVKTTDAAVEFFRTNFDSTLDPSRFRVTTCMTRETEPYFSRKRAGADVIKKFRRMGYNGPILMYSNSIIKAKNKLAKYNIFPETDNVVISDNFKRTLEFYTFSDLDNDHPDVDA